HIEHFWSIPFTSADGIESLLPPNQGNAWFLDVAEGGFVDQNGRVNSFSVFVNGSPGSSSGTTYTTNSVTPMQTAEGQHSVLWIPEKAVTGATVIRLSAAPRPDGGVQLSLLLAADASGTTATVFRSTSDDFASRQPIGESVVHGAMFEFTDAAPEAG